MWFPAQEAHFARLLSAYDAVGRQTWSTDDFLEPNLEVSRNLFTPESIIARRPQPRQLEVFALLSGLPFGSSFTAKLVEVQEQVSAVLDGCLHYWVLPANLGVEYCVFKWPTDSWSDSWIDLIQKALASVHPPRYEFRVRGIQINPDGCIVAKGFDENGTLFQIREHMKMAIPFLPERQSGWAHVPLGRILEPIGERRFTQLSNLAKAYSHLPVATTEINSMKLALHCQIRSGGFR